MKCKLCGEEKVLWNTIVDGKKVYDDICYNCVDKIYMAVAGESCSVLGGLIHDYSKLEKELALYKKALELACESVVKHEKRVDAEMGIIEFFGETFDYDVNEFVEHYLQQAKYKKL